jgi:hypothetical protein
MRRRDGLIPQPAFAPNIDLKQASRELAAGIGGCLAEELGRDLFAYLDTSILFWLCEGQRHRTSPTVKQLREQIGLEICDHPFAVIA